MSERMSKSVPTDASSRDAAGVRQTSISAHTVLTVVVSMTTAEMDSLARMVANIDTYSLSVSEIAIRDEFLAALESVR